MSKITHRSALWRKGTISFLSSLFVLAGVNTAHAATLYVNDNSTSNDIYTTAVGNDANNGSSNAPFLTIQAAIDAAANTGDIVYVDAGYYNENVSINKELTLLGAGKTLSIIDGDNSGSELGTIFLPSGGSHIQIGEVGQGFHIIGLDGPPAIEKAAIYLQGSQFLISIVDNEIEARGDAALMGEYNAPNTQIRIQHNIISGQTFIGSNPAGVGFASQFTLPNVPRQAVVFGGGNSTTLTSRISFEWNTVTTVTGGKSITDNSGNPISPTDQGNMLVTLDLVGSNSIYLNQFRGTTVSGYAALRIRGSGNYDISENNFDGNYNVALITNPSILNINAEYNYWGGSLGPYNAIKTPCGNGKSVPDNVDFFPFYIDTTQTWGTESYIPITINNTTKNTSHCTIQAAIDSANSADTIVIPQGVFEEQIEISKDLMLIGQGHDKTIIKGYSNMPLYFTTSNNNYPIIYVHDAANVILKNLGVDGDGKGNSNYRYQGVAYDNAGGVIGGVHVKNIIETPFNGNQHGIGIFANAQNGTPRDITIQSCTVDNFQKTGISLSGADLTAHLTSNHVIGAGQIGTPLPAQNGIQFYGTAGGDIVYNMIWDCWYTPNTWTATGILLYENASPIVVQNNHLRNNDAHIYAYNSDATISLNTIKDANYGIIAYSYGSNTNTVIVNNEIIAASNAVGVYEGNGTLATASINDNSFTNSTELAIDNGTTSNLNATCNWYGTTDKDSIQSLISGSVSYVPFLINGADYNGNKRRGFVPFSGACPSTQPDSLLIVSDATWMQSTFTNTTEAGGFPWLGVSSLPDVSTYTIPAALGQPKSYHTIDSVEGARVIKSGNGVTFFRTTFDLALDTGVSAQILSRMDDGMEIYINGKLIAREGNYTTDNYTGLPHSLKLMQNGDQDNGADGNIPFDMVNNYRLDSVVTTGENELIIVLRNTLKSYDKGGFTFRMDLKTGEAYMPQLTGYLVSDAEWVKSTTITPGGSHTNWNGNHSLPAVSTYTEDAELGQPRSGYSTEEVTGSFAIKTGSDVTYHRRRFTLIDSADINVRLRSTFDEAVIIYINDVLIAADYTSDVANRALAAHDVMFTAGGPTTNGNAGGDMFEQVENVDFNSILRKGDNYITVVLRNKENLDKGGFSLRLDMDKAGNPVMRKSSKPNGNNGSTEEDNLQLDFTVFPNPTDGILYVDLKGSPSINNEVHILDLNGKILMKRELINPETGMMDIDLSNLPNGMYLIRLKSGEEEYMSKRIMKF